MDNILILCGIQVICIIAEYLFQAFQGGEDDSPWDFSLKVLFLAPILLLDRIRKWAMRFVTIPRQTQPTRYGRDDD